MNTGQAQQRFLVLLIGLLAALVALSTATTPAFEGTVRRANAADTPSRPPVGARAPLAAPWAVLGAPAAWPVSIRLLPLPRPAERAPQPEPALGADAQIVSYYGNPYSAAMGVLGALDMADVAEQLRAQAARYDELNGATRVVPAFHLVYAVAQGHPTSNGRYLQYVADADVRRYLRFTAQHGMLLFLDLQLGRGSVEEEIARVLPYLRHPHVHLALDPEFAVGPGEVPGEALGSLSAAEINEAQAALQRLVRDEGVPPKLLVVHQFADSMVRDGPAIRRYDGVELIVNMDGFGLAAIKQATYRRYAARPYAARAGIKLFFEHDADLMSEAEVFALEPRPALIVYQ